MTFQQTSDQPYDRHHYKIISSRYATFIVKSWQEVHEWLWNHYQIPQIDAVIEILDIPEEKSKGFG